MIKKLAGISFAAFALLTLTAFAETSRPNMVLIMCDDLGYFPIRMRIPYTSQGPQIHGTARYADNETMCCRRPLAADNPPYGRHLRKKNCI